MAVSAIGQTEMKTIKGHHPAKNLDSNENIVSFASQPCDDHLETLHKAAYDH